MSYPEPTVRDYLKVGRLLVGMRVRFLWFRLRKALGWSVVRRGS